MAGGSRADGSLRFSRLVGCGRKSVGHPVLDCRLQVQDIATFRVVVASRILFSGRTCWMYFIQKSDRTDGRAGLIQATPDTASTEAADRHGMMYKTGVNVSLSRQRGRMRMSLFTERQHPVTEPSFHSNTWSFRAQTLPDLRIQRKLMLETLS